MTTIGKVPPNAAAAAYREALSRLGPAPSAVGGSNPNGSGSAFANLLGSELRGAVDDGKKAESTALAGMSGKASLQEVVEAVSRAELGLQKVTAVRDRVIAAYQEILRMPI